MFRKINIEILILLALFEVSISGFFFFQGLRSGVFAIQASEDNLRGFVFLIIGVSGQLARPKLKPWAEAISLDYLVAGSSICIY
jgi:hypothetical protein